MTSWGDGLPYELQLKIHEYVGNYGVLRLVCRRWNQTSTHIFLQEKLDQIAARIRRNQELINEKLGGNLYPARGEALIGINERLVDLLAELGKIESKMKEQEEMSQSILSTNIPLEQQRKMLKLCEPHTEIMLLGGILSKITECEVESGIKSAKRPNRGEDPYRGNPLLVREPNPYVPFPNAPYHPNDPEPDHFLPPGYPVDPRSPFQPMPGVGGVPDRRAPPGFNPDFDRDRDPFAPGGLPFQAPPGRGGRGRGLPGQGPFGPMPGHNHGPHQHDSDPFGASGGGAFF